MRSEKRYCPNMRVSVRGHDANNILIYRPRCKLWSCPYCADVNRKIWRARIMGEIETSPDSDVWHFWTLTLAGSDHNGDTAQSLLVWRASWDKLMKRVKRDLPKMRYVRIFEPHRDGTLHVHMLTDRTYSDVIAIYEDDGRVNYRSSELQAHLAECGLGWRHDLKPIVTQDTRDNGIARNVSAYVVKYMTKGGQSAIRQLLQDSGMSRIRMIQTSQKWYNSSTRSENDIDWAVGTIGIDEYMQLKPSERALDISRNRVINIDHFHDKLTYPNSIQDIVDWYNDSDVDKK